MTDLQAEQPVDETRLALCGASWIAHPSGALFWPVRHLLVVSDLHLEKGSYFAERGVWLPPYDSRTTIGRLAALFDLFVPHTVIALGDSFHDPKGPDRLSPEDRDAVVALTRLCDWVWIAGNHDPRPPRNMGGWAYDEIRFGPFTFRHEPTGAKGEIAGHLHPCATVATRARRLRRRCFVTDGASLVMPAFGAFTGGLDVLDLAFAPLFPGDFRAWLMGRARVYPVAREKLLASAEPGSQPWRF